VFSERKREGYDCKKFLRVWAVKREKRKRDEGQAVLIF